MERSDGVVTPTELAGALAVPEVRASIFRALRSSPYSEHKVVLQELVRSPEGGELVREIARARGTTPSLVRSQVLGGPKLDLYIPNVGHRESWTGAEIPMVADSREYHDGALPVWSSNGSDTTIDPRSGSTSKVLLLIQPSEIKAFRIGLYAELRGQGVQGRGESQEGGLVIRTGMDGHRDTIQLAELARSGKDPGLQLAQACPDDHPEWCAGGGGDGGGSGQDDPVWQTLGTTYLTQITTQGVCDNDLCGLGDTNEFEFTGSWRYGNVSESNTIRITGVPATGVVRDLHLLLLSRVTTLGSPIDVRLVETDTFGDDDFGTLYLEEGHQNLNNTWFPNYPSITPYVAARFTW